MQETTEEKQQERKNIMFFLSNTWPTVKICLRVASILKTAPCNRKGGEGGGRAALAAMPSQHRAADAFWVRRTKRCTGFGMGNVMADAGT